MKLPHALFVILIILSAFSKTTAQNDIDRQKDSLRKVISETEGKEKLKTYTRLANIYMSEVGDDQKMDTLLILFDEMYEEAEKQDNITQQGIIRGNILISFKNNGMFDEVIRRASDCLDFLAKNELWKFYYQISILVIDSYRAKGEFDHAIKEGEKLYALAKEQQNNGGMATALYSIASTYNNQSRLEDAEEYFRECIKLIHDNNSYLNILTQSYAFLCHSLRVQGRFEEVSQIIPEFEEAVHRFEKVSGVTQPTAWANLWTVGLYTYIDAGEYDKAEYYFAKLENEINNQISQYELLRAKAIILTSRKQYPEALATINETMTVMGNQDEFMLNQARKIKMDILIRMGKADEANLLFEDILDITDSIHNLEVNAKFDELRTQYEVDRHIVEKERNRNYFLLALGGCIFLIILLFIWIYYSRLVTGKNRSLVSQIKELQIQQQQEENELLNRATFEPEDKDDGFCPESRRDKLCIAVRDLVLKDKIYRNPSINRDYMLDKLGVSRAIFDDAVQYCFEMSFPEYINHLRMKDALKLLEESDLPIEIIAEKVGYGSIRTFQRQFQNKYNMTPKEYRKLSKEKLN